MRNLLTRVPKSAEALVATTVRTIFQQPSAEAVHARHARVVEQLEARFPEAAAMLDEAAPEVLAFTACPVAHWKQVWSNNPQERLNREIRRRTDVVGIFPNRAAVVRLVGAVLAEQHDEWAVARRYMTMVTSPPAPRAQRLARWPPAPIGCKSDRTAAACDVGGRTGAELDEVRRRAARFAAGRPSAKGCRSGQAIWWAILDSNQ